MGVYSQSGNMNVTVNDTTRVGRYAADGSIRITVVSGSAFTGLNASDGSMNIVDVTGESINTYKGLYHPSGAIRGRLAPFGSYAGFYAPDGALYLTGFFNPVHLFSSGENGAWYDPSDFSTMFQDSAGTTPVTAVTQPVGRILDKSGKGNHATQPTSTDRPTLQQDASGKYFLLFDGSNDNLYTGSIDLSGTNKLSVFAGIRKLSDAGIAVLAEFGTGALNGSFFLAAPRSGGAGNYGFNSQGTSVGDVVSASSWSAPVTTVLTGLSDISGDTTYLRADGVLIGSNTTSDQGTGNYGNYSLFIASRFASSLRFNGRLYSMIIRGAASSAAEINATETWVNSKTGAY
jgi:hypothetical protein